MTADGPIELAKNGASSVLAQLDRALEAGQIDETEWYRRVAQFITPRYLAAATPWGQSGRSGDAVSFERARSLLADAALPGTFLDIGCASGYLMECWVRWCAARGVATEPYGLDIAPELVELARTRLPAWRERIWTGNAFDWIPPQRFDVVRTGLEYVPARDRSAYVTRLLDELVADGGRLIIGVFNEERAEHSAQALLDGWGFSIAGAVEREHPDDRLSYRALWIDR